MTQARHVADPQVLADVANTLADITYVLRLEPEMRFEYVSDSVADVVGYTPEDHYADPGLGMRLVDPEDLPTLTATMDYPPGEVFEYTVRWRSRDSRTVWTNHRCVTRRDEDGSLVLYGIARDVTDLKSAEERFRLLAENASDVVLRIDQGLVTWASPSLTRSLGWSPQDWHEKPLDTFTHPDDRGTVVQDGAAARLRVADPDGHYHWMEVRARPIPDEEPEGGLVVSMQLADAMVRYEQALRRRARIDDLTDALNRGEIIGQIEGNGAVLFCDVDSFKGINDTFGHVAGDEALKTVVHRIRQSVPGADAVGRMGGDEFLVVLPGLSSLDTARQVAEEIRQSIPEPISVGGRELHVTLSIGVTLFTAGEDPDAVISRADAAMYEAKRLGRDRVVALTA